ncbi:MAG TPA: hypothetical protein VNM68_14285 [Candidatus Polarisedimenticolia bacterium]|nr:hypothetical protein [Candidatus Polarisedimenticolia bacterium]
MPTLKIHLEKDEFAPIERAAMELKVRVEDIAYAGLDSVMRNAKDEATIKLIQRAKSARQIGLPSWADRPHEIHAYESMA